MKVNLTSRHFKAHETLKEHAEIELQKIDKFYDGLMKAEVILSYEKPSNSIKSAEIIVTSNSHHTFTATGRSDDFKVSIESAVDKLVTQIKKHKEKIRSSVNHRL